MTIGFVGRLAALIAGADLATKLVVTGLVPSQGTGPFTVARNPEFSLGLIGGTAPALAAVSLAVLVVFAVGTLVAVRRGRLAAWIPGAIIGGSLGNLADRVVTGAVHDFLIVPGAGIVINLADVAVVVGVAGLMHATWRGGAPAADRSGALAPTPGP